MPQASVIMKTWLIPVSWFVLLTAGSLLPGKTLPSASWNVFDNFDKVLHFLAYFGLMALIGLANKRKTLLNQKGLLSVVIILAFYGVLLESIQAYMAHDRYFEVLDILANIMGLITAYWISVRTIKSKKDGI